MIDIFKVGVSIAMTSNASQVLGVMLTQLGGVNNAVTALNKNLASTQVVAAAAMTALAGGAVLMGLTAIVNKARNLNDELSRLKMLGGEFASSIGRARDAAFQTTFGAPTGTAGGNVAMQREISGIVGDPAIAAQLLPEVSRAAYVASFYTKEDPSKIAQNLLKMADVRGALLGDGPDGKKFINWEALKPDLEMAIKALVIQGGALSSGDLLGMVKQGSVPFRSMSAESAYLDMAEIASVLGGQRSGTALTSLFQQLIGGKMTKQTAQALTDAGMLLPTDWTSGRSGGVVVSPEGTRRFSAMERDPAQWFASQGQEKIRAYAEANGVSEVQAIFRLFGRQTTQRLVAEILSSEPQIARTREIAAGMKDYSGQYDDLLKENLTTNIRAFQSAWTTLMEALGAAAVPTAITLLQSLTTAIQGMTKWALDNPDTVTTLMHLTAGMGAFAIAIGAFAIGSAAAGALAVLNGPLGVAALAAGLTALAGSLSGFPSWLVSMVTGAAAGAGVGMRFGGAQGAVFGAALGGLTGVAINPPTGPDLNPSSDRPSRITNEPVGAGLRSWMGRLFGRDDRQEPLRVVVTNPQDIEQGVVGAVTRTLRLPSPGGFDPRGPGLLGVPPT